MTWPWSDERYDDEPDNERCANCGIRDVSIVGPRGAFCGRECRDALYPPKLTRPAPTPAEGEENKEDV